MEIPTPGSHFCFRRILLNVRLAFALFLLFASAAAFAHPPVSVVIDSKGNVYYSDLDQVWRVAPNGTRSVAVPGVHTHELYIDAQDTLFGEHLWYEGERIDKWGHYVWKRTADGRVSKVIPAREGFLTNYSFVRDRAGNMYWADRERAQIRMRAPDGKITPVAGNLKGMRWMHATPDGTIYVLAGRDLVRVKNRRPTRVVQNLAGMNFVRPHVSLMHAVMGIWTDRQENVYVADHANGVVKKITQAGAVSTVLRSPTGWSPAGGTFAANGELWVLETTPTNAVRVRKATLSFRAGVARRRIPCR